MTRVIRDGGRLKEYELVAFCYQTRATGHWYPMATVLQGVCIRAATNERGSWSTSYYRPLHSAVDFCPSLFFRRYAVV